MTELNKTTHEQIVEAYETYLAEHTRFVEKKIKACAPRARKALHELVTLGKSRRKEIQAEKDLLSTPKPE